MIEQASFALRGRNPDVLTCIANLSNDEVFTPPEFANRMLDTLAEAWAERHDGADIGSDSSVRFLDPFTKSGIFLREIATRLIKGLEAEIPDLQERVDHILTKQVYGIAITRLTSLLARRSLYCSKYANGPHSASTKFENESGNIWFERTEHTWVGQKCSFCGAPRSVLDRGDDMETHAYAFIHAENIKSRVSEIFGEDMQFDVIIGNPPYQLGSDGGTRDVPIYQKFVEQAKALQPRFLSMIIPSRWMATGLGLSNFRSEMLSDSRLREIVDFPVAKEVFSGVEVKGGVCYFLWDVDHDGECNVTTIRGNEVTGPIGRKLSEFDVFVRDAKSAEILRKVLSKKTISINSILSSDKEFGWTSNFDDFRRHPSPNDIPLHYVRKGKRSVGYIAREHVKKSADLIDDWKVMVPSAGSDASSVPDYVLSKPFIAPAPSVCTQTYLFFSVRNESEARSLLSYLGTRFLRFLVSLRKITQHATRSTYEWVPSQSWDRVWTDAELYAFYGLSVTEQEHINSFIKQVSWAEGDEND